MMDREEYKVVWSGPHGEGEYTAVGTFAAFGYGIQSRDMGAEVVNIIHNGITLSLEEFEKTWRRA